MVSAEGSSASLAIATTFPLSMANPAFKIPSCLAILQLVMIVSTDMEYPPEVVAKPHLRLNGCVIPRIEMLTYYVYAPLSIRVTP
jgi:hypothetical protein